MDSLNISDNSNDLIMLVDSEDEIVDQQIEMTVQWPNTLPNIPDDWSNGYRCDQLNYYMQPNCNWYRHQEVWEINDIFDFEAPLNPVGLHINELTEDILFYIFNFLEFNQRFTLRRVCRKWKVLAEETFLSEKQLDHKTLSLPKSFSRNLGILSIISLTDCCQNLNHLDLSQFNEEFDMEIISTNISKMRLLKYLNISNKRINDGQIEMIARKCSKLQTLLVANCVELSDWTLIYLVNFCPFIKILILDGCNIAGGFSLFKKMIHLKHLSIMQCNKIIKQAYKDITTHNNLQSLSITSYGQKNIFRLACSGLKNLRNLTVQFEKDIHSLNLTPLNQAKNLKYLSIEADNFLFHDANIAQIFDSNLNLKELKIKLVNWHLRGDFLSAVAFQRLPEVFPTIESLMISHAKELSEDIIPIISQLKFLKSLSLEGCAQIGDNIISLIKSSIKLRHLNVVSCPVSYDILLAMVSMAQICPQEEFSLTMSWAKENVDHNLPDIPENLKINLIICS